jgi:DNA-binding NarL/FixJ family response regulator
LPKITVLNKALIKRALSLVSLKYDVEEAEVGAMAIAFYKKGFESDSPFDAVVTDLVVPGKMGGKEATKELLKIDPEAKVVVASGYIDDSTMSKYKEFGFQGVLSKTYEIDELDEILQKVIILKE